jgi:hypothetical protein
VVVVVELTLLLEVVQVVIVQQQHKQLHLQ